MSPDKDKSNNTLSVRKTNGFMFMELGYNVRCSQPERDEWDREKKIKLKSSVRYFINVERICHF